MSRIGRNIYKRKDGRWEGRIKVGRINGRTIYKSVYGNSYSETRVKLMEKIKIYRLTNPSYERDKQKITFRAISALWLASIKEQRKESSIIKYEDLLQSYLLPAIGNKEMAKISSKDLEKLSRELMLKGGKRKQGLSPQTIRQILSIARSIRRYAIRNNYPVGYTTDDINIRKQKHNIRVFTSHEVQEMLRVLMSDIKNRPETCSKKCLTAIGILLSLSTGIREGELCALKWDAVNLTEKTLKVYRTMKRLRSTSPFSKKSKTSILITSPKSESSIREIPLPDDLIELIRPFYIEGAYILTGEADTFVEPRTLQYRFKSILKRSGIESGNYHALRHTFATRCVEIGFDIKSLSEILGHSSVAITMDRYVHPTLASKASNMDKLMQSFNI
ncbi:tyrosine-type recombinase/integrase [Butyrivibrio sp. MC2013]|uniref:tyrosine-type recombinase/integrase n=1 Tax=Butyrivibrio sp. MC2013 TaxID=1280686 RepID=UPI00042810F1|nr:site-specific integrase [Butyrivibrio sp. MC2013]